MRYEIKERPEGFYVWDNELQVWQCRRDTRAEVETWIEQRLIADKNPKPSTLKIRMPQPD